MIKELLIESALAADESKNVPNSLNDATNNILKKGPGLELKDIVDAIPKIIDVALNLAAVVALIMIMYASLQYVFAYGDESKAENGKKTLIWSIVGLAITLTAKLMVSLLKKALN